MWLIEAPALRNWITPRESLDSIDRAYLEQEFPLMIISYPTREYHREMAEAIRACVARCGLVGLPSGAKVEILETKTPRPLELARWADDGGRV